MAREGLFNILNNILDYNELYILDLFSGTGSISYEFASRGATIVHSVELNAKHASFIAGTARKLELETIRVYRTDIRKYLSSSKVTYNLIFADPPYNLEWIDDIPDMVINSACMDTHGLFILEHPGEYNFSNHKYFFQHRKYGSVNFSFFSMPQ